MFMGFNNKIFGLRHISSSTIEITRATSGITTASVSPHGYCFLLNYTPEEQYIGLRIIKPPEEQFAHEEQVFIWPSHIHSLFL